MTRRSINLIQFWLTVAFFLIPTAAFAITGFTLFEWGQLTSTTVDLHSYVTLTILVTLLWELVIQHFKLDRVDTVLTIQTGINMAMRVTSYSTILVLALLFFYRTVSFARIFVVCGCALTFVLTMMIIHLFRGVITIFEKVTNVHSRVAIIGADNFADQVAQHLAKNRFTFCKVACFVALPNQFGVSSESDYPVLEWDRLDEIVDTFHCREALIALAPNRFGEVQEILNRLQYLCIPVRMVLDLGEGIFVPDRLFNFWGLPLLDVRSYPIDSISYAVGKRAFDIMFSSAVLICAAPLILLIALIVKFTSSGPVFFSQERVSLNGRRFKMFKFRTMFVQDTDSSNSRHTEQADPRVTPIGRILRANSLDELPQFINVLKGDMSVVGPRPELTFFVQKFGREIPAYMARHNVKCGITGWAQINGLRGSHTSIAERIQYDLHYMRHWSMTLDLKIIFRTVVTGFASRTAL
jgi:Undecaprenyl-phosphate glucose phosphotransferase